MDHSHRWRNLLYVLILFIGVPSAVVWGDNWGHWRGPTGNGGAPNATPPTEWSDTQNVKWQVRIDGRGSGSPVVWEDRVFVVTAIVSQTSSSSPNRSRGDAQQSKDRSGRTNRERGNGALVKTAFRVLCFERNSGKTLWEKTSVEATPHQGVHQTNNFASASPCTDGKHVYAFFGSRGLYCYTLDGKLVWKRDDFGRMDTRNGFGEGSSPTIVGNKIIVPWDHEGPSALYALDKLTGKTIWKTSRDEPTNWSTPLIVDNGGKQQVVMNGQNYARGYDLDSGRELWRCGGQTQRPCASAVYGQGLIFVGSGFRGAFLGAFQPDGKGDIQGTQSVVWSVDRDTPDIASPLLTGGRLYFHKGKTGMISCFDAKTGKPHYTATRVSGLSSIYASPVSAGGYVFLTGRSGRTVVLKEDDQFQVISTNSLGEMVDATPAPVGNQLFIRGEKHLFCIQEENTSSK
ncbi:MAG: PQQ-binding-like beta-propeller repeat protein [Planctomycetota bacterium]|nr:PQQ-binding-like beta-propeller repeat protein [Planctomycetota bacterium]